MLTCKEVSRAIAAGELTTASWRQRLTVRFHLLMCQACRLYAAQIRSLGGAVRNVAAEQASDSDSRERLRESILNRIPVGEEDATESDR